MDKKMEEAVRKALNKKIQETILYGAGGAETPAGILPTTTAAAFDPHDTTKFEEIVEEMYKNRIIAQPDPSIKQGEVLVVNHEMIREDVPWYKLRGKSIHFNPKDLKIKKVLIEQGIQIQEVDHD